MPEDQNFPEGEVCITLYVLVGIYQNLHVTLFKKKIINLITVGLAHFTPVSVLWHVLIYQKYYLEDNLQTLTSLMLLKVQDEVTTCLGAVNPGLKTCKPNLFVSVFNLSMQIWKDYM